MINYAKALPRDRSGEPMQQYPSPNRALSVNSSENNTVSSIITLTDNTTALEIAAVGVGAAFRWVATSDTQASVVAIAGATANFDHIIPVTNVRRFVVPIESMPQTSIVGANKQNGLFNRIAIRSLGIGSVLTTEY